MPQGTDGARDKLAVLRFPVPCRAKPVAGSFCPLCAAAAAHLLFRKRSKNIGLRALAAPGLPGQYSPLAAARLMRREIEAALEEGKEMLL